MTTVALDSDALSHLLRQPRPKSRSTPAKRQNDFDACVLCRKITVAVDPSRGVIDEWCRTCGHEYVKVVVTKWIECGGIAPVKLGKIPEKTSKALRTLNFKDQIDRLLIRVALGTHEKTIVSEDSDFWHPRQKSSKCGNGPSPVRDVLAGHLGVRVLCVGQMLGEV